MLGRPSRYQSKARMRLSISDQWYAIRPRTVHWRRRRRLNQVSSTFNQHKDRHRFPNDDDHNVCSGAVPGARVPASGRCRFHRRSSPRVLGYVLCIRPGNILAARCCQSSHGTATVWLHRGWQRQLGDERWRHHHRRVGRIPHHSTRWTLVRVHGQRLRVLSAASTTKLRHSSCCCCSLRDTVRSAVSPVERHVAAEPHRRIFLSAARTEKAPVLRRPGNGHGGTERSWSGGGW